MEPAGCGAKGGDCRDPVRHRGVIPEARIEAKARVGGTFCHALSVLTGLQIIDLCLALCHASSSVPHFSFTLRLSPGPNMLNRNLVVFLVQSSHRDISETDSVKNGDMYSRSG